MVQKYKRKTERQLWDEDKMREAMEEVRRGLSYKTAARNFDVPLMSLKRRCKGTNKLAVNAIKKLGSKRPVFTVEQEEELVAHILDMESRMYGLTTKDVRSIAYQLADKNNIDHPFSKKTCLAGKDWLTGFRNRHPELSLRSPESTSAARARAFNRPVVTKFFTLLKTVYDKIQFPAHRIFNVDETSLSTVPGKNCKVLAQRGRKQVGRVVSAERGVSTTSVICMSASGSYVPPMVIFARKRMKEELKDGAPPGTAFYCNDSGWMKLEVFAVWFDHFLSFIKPSQEDPALLILDGHLSHTKNLSVVEKARNNFVTILCLPPHTTHKLQPLDVSFMYPLNHYHDKALEKWLINHPGSVVTVFQISQIFNESYMQACTPLNAINGFKKTGIFPYDPDVFTNIDFAAAEVTEQNEPQNDNAHEENDAAYEPNEDVTDENNVAYEQNGEANKKRIESNEQNDILPTTVMHSLASVSEPSTSRASSGFKILPNDIHPLPKMAQEQRSSKSRKSGGTIILTSTPYKDQLLEEQQKKEKQAEKKLLKNKNKLVEKKEKNKRPGVRKYGNNKRRKQDKIDEKSLEESEVEDDTECLICTETFLQSHSGEGWVQCSICYGWAHNECAGIDDNDCDPYCCDYCIDNAKVNKVRKQLVDNL